MILIPNFSRRTPTSFDWDSRKVKVCWHRSTSEKPGNHLTLLFENYIDFLTGFITEEENDFVTLKKISAANEDNFEKTKTILRRRFTLYVQAEIIIQEAMLKVKLKNRYLLQPIFRKAYRLIEKNRAIFPTFYSPTKKLVGFLPTFW